MHSSSGFLSLFQRLSPLLFQRVSPQSSPDFCSSSALSGEGDGSPLQHLPGKSHGRRGLVGCGSWGREESDRTERLHFHFPLSCTGEGNGNLLQCSCLENPRDRGAWWDAVYVYGVAQSRPRLMRLSSSSSIICQSRP